MKLLTKAIEKKLPKLGSQDGKGDDAMVYLKLFHPCSSYTCYVLEYDGNDQLFTYTTMGYGYELGYASLAEITDLKLMGLGVERDLYFTPKTLGEIKKEVNE